MKYIYLLSLLSLVAFSSPAQSRDEKAIAARVETLRTAMIDGNRAALENIAADSLSYGHSGGKVENKMDFVENIANGKPDSLSSGWIVPAQNSIAEAQYTFMRKMNSR